MKIQNSVVNFASYSQKTESYKKSESLNVWKDNPQESITNNNGQNKKNDKNDILEISKEAEKEFVDSQKAGKNSDENITFKLSDKDKQKVQLIESFIEALTGKKIKIKLYMDEEEGDKNIAPEVKTQDVKQNFDFSKKGWGINYNFSEEYHEKQTMGFSSNGIVKTSDGKEINFNLDIKMSREFYKKTNISYKAGDALVDPLVINFDSNSVGLEDKKFSFDIDNNGKIDQISTLSKGSGFLTLDKNNDGIINNGSELFGPKTGDGFDELSKYDSDGNNWIDENDEIFDKLRIWVRDEKGNNKLFALGEKGIGAIFVGNINTEYSLKNNENNTKGVIKKTGIYLKESGQAGTIQHVNFAI